jgi:hypothetical protein
MITGARVTFKIMNNKFKAAALAVLKKSGKPLHYREITRMAIDDGLLETIGATPEASLNAQLSVDIKIKGKASQFVRTSPGYYTINQDYKAPAVAETESEEEEKVKIEGGYTGKAGEHLVCSELLFRGFNASIMSVDVGMDIIATKDNKLFSVQVKTANLNRFEAYVFDVRKVSFERHNSGNIFYVFVLRGEENDFLIIPLHEMEKKVHEKAILEVGHGNRYRVNIKFRNETVYLGSKAHDMNYYLNNWSIIK